MTAAVPDPRFRDQLAEALAGHQPVQRWVNYQWEGWGCSCGVMAADFRQHLADSLAAEVEARVQAAANQRAVEAWQGAADELTDYSKRCAQPDARGITLYYSRRFAARAAALASPAPAPDGA